MYFVLCLLVFCDITFQTTVSNGEFAKPKIQCFNWPDEWQKGICKKRKRKRIWKTKIQKRKRKQNENTHKNDEKTKRKYNSITENINKNENIIQNEYNTGMCWGRSQARQRPLFHGIWVAPYLVSISLRPQSECGSRVAAPAALNARHNISRWLDCGVNVVLSRGDEI